MQKSESIKNIAEAMNNVQTKIVGATKDSTNSFFKSKYANLESVMEAIRKPFSEFGLSYVQSSRVTDSGGLILETMLMHTSGEWISGEYPVRAIKDDPQALGAATSYARRFALSAMCGVAQVDDDAESIMDRKPPQSTQKPVTTWERP